MKDDSDSDFEKWITYDAFVEERFEQLSNMLDQIDYHVLGGPPFQFPEPPDFFLPPPPIPGNVEKCVTFSSHFESCDISKVYKRLCLWQSENKYITPMLDEYHYYRKFSSFMLFSSQKY